MDKRQILNIHSNENRGKRNFVFQPWLEKTTVGERRERQ